MNRIISIALSVIVTASVLGGGFLAFAGSASATADGTTYASVTKLTGESYNGQVDGITVSSTGIVEWESMKDNVESVSVTLEAKTGPESGWHEFASKTYTDVSSSGEDSYSYGTVSGDLIESTSFESEDFSADKDGERRKEYVPVRVTVTVTGADGAECSFSEVHKVRTVVSNLAEPEASGDTKIGGEIDMDESESECETC